MINTIVVNIGNQASSLGKVVITEQNRDIVPPQRVDGWIATPGRRIIHNVIVNERRQVYHLKGDAQGQQFIEAVRFHLARK